MKHSTPTVPPGRERLVRVLEHAGDVIHIHDVAAVLETTRAQASKQLSRWVEQRWLRRIGPGAYIAVPLEMLDVENVLEDPWILVPHLFSPGYIGGWSAAEHWDLTEQLFRTTLVCTSRTIRTSRVDRQGTTFELRHIPKHEIFGTQTVWRQNTKVPVSDIHRTVVDMVNNPAWGGGIQHVTDCFDRYINSPEFNSDKMLNYVQRLDNGALYKRIGFLTELKGLKSAAQEFHQWLTTGYAQLDHDQRCEHLITRWRLWVPRDWQEQFERS